MENIFDAVKPFYYISKLFGMFPSSYEGDIKGRFKTRWSDIAASCCSLSILIVFIALSLFVVETPSSASNLLSQLWGAEASFGTILLLFAYLYQISKVQSFVNFLQSVDKIDKKVSTRRLSKF